MPKRPSPKHKQSSGICKEILKKIASNYSTCLKDVCQDTRIKLDLKNFNKTSYLILKGEETILDGETVCDCLIFIANGTLRVCLVELKSGRVDISHVKKQIDGGIKCIHEIFKNCSIDIRKINYLFYPVLIHNNISATEFSLLRNTKITFIGKKYNFLHSKPSISLKEILARVEI